MTTEAIKTIKVEKGKTEKQATNGWRKKIKKKAKVRAHHGRECAPLTEKNKKNSAYYTSARQQIAVPPTKACYCRRVLRRTPDEPLDDPDGGFSDFERQERERERER
jgi:hypothetical protein